MPECEWPTLVGWFWVLQESPLFVGLLTTIPIVLLGVILYRLDRRRE